LRDGDQIIVNLSRDGRPAIATLVVTAVASGGPVRVAPV
jgi:hypothetical protein